jgi:hypothetical protein
MSARGEIKDAVFEYETSEFKGPSFALRLSALKLNLVTQTVPFHSSLDISPLTGERSSS